MKITFKKPSLDTLETWTAKRKGEALSYQHPKATLEKEFPKGFDHDRNKCLLGKGDAIFELAKEGIRNWIIFPKAWIINHPTPLPLEVGQEVAVVFNMLGAWWFNSCRIQYLIEEPNRFGFAYGTLLSHVEKGEEVFWIEKRANGEIWYNIQAFSQPHYWWVKPFKPLVRAYQRKFVRESCRDMQAYVKKKASS
ncbi:MAG: DUF1990 domain-containing protein [Aureispira sp.]|nr:DUF1990 domain-containing protein [Aureispira sp.]